MSTSRRSFVSGLICAIVSPAIERASSLMPIKSLSENWMWSPFEPDQFIVISISEDEGYTYIKELLRKDIPLVDELMRVRRKIKLETTFPKDFLHVGDIITISEQK